METVCTSATATAFVLSVHPLSLTRKTLWMLAIVNDIGTRLLTVPAASGPESTRTSTLPTSLDDPETDWDLSEESDLFRRCVMLMYPYCQSRQISTMKIMT